MRFLLALLLLVNFPVFAKSMVASVKLNPMGSFEAKNKRIRGTVVKKGEVLQAAGIQIPVRSFETDNETRDDHLKDKLEMKKHPNITVDKAVGKGGKGMAQITMRGVSQKVPFTYADKGKEVDVKFTISLKAFGISGISYMGVGVEDNVVIKATLPLK